MRWPRIPRLPTGGINYGTPLQKHVTVGLLLAFAVMWPLAGWPWWPIIVAVGLVLVLRVLTFDKLLSGWTGALAAGILAVWCVPYVSVWTALTAAGAGGVLVGLLRLPRWHVLALAAVVLIPGAVGFTWERIQDARAAQAELAEQATEAYAKVLPQTPDDALYTLHVLLAEPGGGTDFCYLFSAGAAAQFAASTHTSGCDVAYSQLAGKVTNGTAYTQYNLPDTATTVTGDTAVVNGCAATWDSTPPPGPQLGKLALARLLPGDGGFQIVGYYPCGPATTTRPSVPTTTTLPTALPSEPTDLVTDLLNAYASTDYSVCSDFTTAGAQQYAAASGVTTCQLAVQKFSRQVTNTSQYPYPSIISYTTGTDPAGQTTVNACQLDWSADGFNSGPAPGPQLGHLTLTQPPGRQGYLIAGFQSC